ncbi:MAG: hypothetical protein II155_02625 [Clostridia bacterium]|nr:hypothetical protein [Clostridia bacterium]
MTARRIIYIALLIGAALLHFAYGQYATHFILLFLLLAPVFSVLITLPAAIRARVTLTRGADVLRGRETGVGLSFETFGLLPPEGWSAVVSSKNLFTGSEGPKHKVRLMGQKRYETEFPVDSSEIGSIRYTIRCPKCRA